MWCWRATPSLSASDSESDEDLLERVFVNEDGEWISDEGVRSGDVGRKGDEALRGDFW